MNYHGWFRSIATQSEEPIPGAISVPRKHNLVLLASEVEEVLVTPAVSVTEHWHLPFLDFVG